MLELRKDNDAARYEALIDGEVVGYATFSSERDVVTIAHTFVEPARRDHGVARTLVEYALADIRSEGKSVRPTCPYVAWIIREDPAAYRDLVPAEERSDFGLR